MSTLHVDFVKDLQTHGKEVLKILKTLPFDEMSIEDCRYFTKWSRFAYLLMLMKPLSDDFQSVWSIDLSVRESDLESYERHSMANRIFCFLYRIYQRPFLAHSEWMINPPELDKIFSFTDNIFVQKLASLPIDTMKLWSIQLCAYQSTIAYISLFDDHQDNLQNLERNVEKSKKIYWNLIHTFINEASYDTTVEPYGNEQPQQQQRKHQQSHTLVRKSNRKRRRPTYFDDYCMDEELCSSA